MSTNKEITLRVDVGDNAVALPLLGGYESLNVLRRGALAQIAAEYDDAGKLKMDTHAPLIDDLETFAKEARRITANEESPLITLLNVDSLALLSTGVARLVEIDYRNEPNRRDPALVKFNEEKQDYQPFLTRVDNAVRELRSQEA